MAGRILYVRFRHLRESRGLEWVSMQHLLPMSAALAGGVFLILAILGRRNAAIARRERAERRRTHIAMQAAWDRDHPLETTFPRSTPDADEPPPAA